MGEQLRMTVGGWTHLKSQPMVDRWSSDRPDIVSVSDVDVIHGRPGGELRALKPGRARILGMEGKTVHVCVDVIVEVEQTGLALTTGQRGQFRLPPGDWTFATRQKHVVEIAKDGNVRALSPGIAVINAKGTGGSAVQLEVRVTGTLEMQAGQSVSLSDRVGVPVAGWRTGSSAVATIDANGKVHAGQDARTTPVIVTLASGGEFTFDLRIRPEVPQTPTERTSERIPVPAASREDQIPEPAAAPDETPIAPGSLDLIPPGQEEVNKHLERFDDLVSQQRWEDAVVMLQAAGISARDDEYLKDQVRRAAGRLDRAKRDIVAGACVQALVALTNDDPEQFHRLITGVPLPEYSDRIASASRQLAEQIDVVKRQTHVKSEDRCRDLVAAIGVVWREAAQQKLVPVLIALAQFINAWGLTDDLVPLVIDSLMSMSGDDRSILDTEAILRSIGTITKPGVEALLDKLGQADRKTGKWVLYMLREINLHRVGGWVAAYYHACHDAGRRKKLLDCLLEMGKDSPRDLIVLIARSSPPDLARDLIRGYGRSEIEKQALLYSAHEPSAKIVLRRFFGFQNL